MKHSSQEIGSREQNQWADENPHVVLPSHHQPRFSINIWDSICGDNLFGPHVLPNKHSGWNYKAFLENMADFLADVPLIIRRELRFNAWRCCRTDIAIVTITTI
jgi:hypothetical protein